MITRYCLRTKSIMSSTSLTLIVICSLIVVAWTFDDNPLSDDFINKINTKQSRWKAGRNFDPNTPFHKLKGLLGVVDQSTEKVDRISYDLSDNFQIPESFDARENWSTCKSISRIYDQANCGSCWAVSTAAAMSDRTCIQSFGAKNVIISAKNLMTCGIEEADGCLGGSPLSAWLYWGKNGIVTGGAYNTTEGCQNYPFPECEHYGATGNKPACDNFDIAPNCSYTCDEGTNLSYKDSLTYGEYSYMLVGREDTIQEDILQYGPAVAVFSVYEDFFSYKSGVYYHTVGEFVGKHAVKILGWGIEDDFKYWLVANSWNTDWGDNGTFKIRRSFSECGFEDEVTGGTYRV